MAKFDKVIPPGQTGKITATIDSKKYSGKLDKAINVVSNDPIKPKTVVNLKCSILGVTILPTSRAYFNTYTGQSQTKELNVATLGDAEINAHAIASKPNIVLRLEKTDHKKPVDKNEYWIQYKLFITIPENYPEGRFAESVTVASNSEYTTTSHVRIAGSVSPALVVSPAVVRLNSTNGKKLPQRIIKLTKKIGDDFAVTNVIVDPPQLKATVEETEKGRQFSVKLSWSDIATKGQFDGKVVIHTNDRRRPVINVPVHVSIK